MSVAPIQREPGTLGTTLTSSESQRDTYSIVTPLFTPAATPTCIFSLQGSSTRVVAIKRCYVNSSGNTNGLMNLYVYKRTAANTGGTTVSLVSSVAKYDTNSPTASIASLVYYTANPSALGAGKAVFGDNLQFGTSGQPVTAEIEFSRANDMPPRLKDNTEYFTLNLNGGTVPTGGQIFITVVWEEYLLNPTPTQ